MYPLTVGGKTYQSYEEFLADRLSILERIGDVFSGLDERLDFLNATMLRVEAALKGLPEVAPIVVPEVPAVIPEFPPITIPLEPGKLLRDLILINLSLDMRHFLIMMYRLGRAYEERAFYYSEVGAGLDDDDEYTVEKDFIYIPHIEEVSYGIQRVFTRKDYEGGDLKHTELNATDRTVEWGMTPLSKIITGSFKMNFENTGTTDSWVKTRFIGTLLRDSDYLWWRKTVRSLGDKYLGLE